MFKGINAIEFNKRFSNNEACYQYLIAWKWGKGFVCCKCGCSESNKEGAWTWSLFVALQKGLSGKIGFERPNLETSDMNST